MTAHTNQERAEFEAWACDRYPSIDLTRDGGDYTKALAKDYWSLWQAACRAPATPQAQADARDAARYHWLRNRMLGVEFNWGENGITALVFEVPDGCAYSRDCDQSIDTAIAAQAKKVGA